MRFIIILSVLLASSWSVASIDFFEARKLLEESGVDKQLIALRQQIDIGISEARKQKRNVGDEKWQSLENMVRASFETEKLFPQITETVAATMTEADLILVRRWMDSTLGKKVQRLEDAATAPEVAEEKLNALQTMAPNELRMERVHDLDNQLNASMSLVDLSINLQTALVALTTSTQPAAMRPDIDMIKATLDMNRFEFQIETKSQVLSSFVYTYDALSDEEFMHYLKFVKSPEGNRFQRLMMDSVVKAVTKATDDLTKKLSKI